MRRVLSSVLAGGGGDVARDDRDRAPHDQFSIG
jgi:hypothetical protein